MGMRWYESPSPSSPWDGMATIIQLSLLADRSNVYGILVLCRLWMDSPKLLSTTLEVGLFPPWVSVIDSIYIHTDGPRTRFPMTIPSTHGPRVRSSDSIVPRLTTPSSFVSGPSRARCGSWGFVRLWVAALRARDFVRRRRMPTGARFEVCPRVWGAPITSTAPGWDEKPEALWLLVWGIMELYGIMNWYIPYAYAYMKVSINGGTPK